MASYEASIKGRRVTTGMVRLSYANLLEPREDQQGRMVYSTSILIPKSDKKTIAAIRAAEKVAATDGKDRVFNGKIPSVLASKLRDADSPEEEETLEKNPAYAGHYFMNIWTNTRPGVVDQNVQPIMDASEVYSGMWARVTMEAAAYSAQGNKGISFYLGNVQKLKDDEAFAGGAKAEDEFGIVDDLDEDEDEDEGLI